MCSPKFKKTWPGLLFFLKRPDVCHAGNALCLGKEWSKYLWLWLIDWLLLELSFFTTWTNLPGSPATLYQEYISGWVLSRMKRRVRHFAQPAPNILHGVKMSEILPWCSTTIASEARWFRNGAVYRKLKTCIGSEMIVTHTYTKILAMPPSIFKRVKSTKTDTLGVLVSKTSNILDI